MAPNARIDQLGRETFTTNNPKADLNQLGREAFITVSPRARIVAMGREAWVPVGAGVVTTTQPNICVIC